jgi:hypothetical protein
LLACESAEASASVIFIVAAADPGRLGVALQQVLALLLTIADAAVSRALQTSDAAGAAGTGGAEMSALRRATSGHELMRLREQHASQRRHAASLERERLVILVPVKFKMRRCSSVGRDWKPAQAVQLDL